jgi:hypothetical protein
MTENLALTLRMHTPATLEAHRSFDLLDNFATRCEPGGMPLVMFAPLSYELVDQGTTIELRGEAHDTVRTIHMDRAEPPPGEAASILGYSVGRWENGDLVVTTTLVDWPYFDTRGTPQSRDVEFVERFSLSDEQSRLHLEMEIRDPVYQTVPGKVGVTWFALGQEMQRFDCQRTP